jgi:hypothetical protein
MDVKMESEFYQPFFGEDKDAKLEGDLFKEDEALPSSRVSVSMPPQPVVMCE